MSSRYTTPTHTKTSLSAKPTKSPFGYYGAKLKIAKSILKLIPPHNAWVEGFCGSAALTLAKEPAPIEIINDADGQIVNLFEQLRTNSRALCEAVSLTPYARQEWELAKYGPEANDRLERARRFLVATMMTVNGTYAAGPGGFSYSQSYAREGREARVNRWYNLPKRLETVVERLRGIRVENRDACEMVEMLSNRPATLIYLDPPYFVKRPCGYAIDANDLEFHTRLLSACKKANCMLLISAYENNLYSKMLSKREGWEKRVIETHTRDTKGRDFARAEILWMNARFVKAKKDCKVPIRLSKKEKHNRQINPTRTR